MSDVARDALIQEVLDDAFAEFEHLLPPDARALFRAELEDALEAHPHGSTLLRRALQDPELDESGETRRTLGAFEEPSERGKSGTGPA